MLDREILGEIYGDKTVTIGADKLDLFASKYGISKFVKIDVEEFEAAIIIIEDMKRAVDLVSCPIIHEALSERAQSKYSGLAENGVAISYSFRVIGGGGELLKFYVPRGSSDYLALPDWALGRVNKFRVRL